MSYARFGEDGSDVYLYSVAPCGDYFECCSCTLKLRGTLPTPQAAIRHLEEHVAAGDCVPARAFELLLADTEHGPPWTNGVT